MDPWPDTPRHDVLKGHPSPRWLEWTVISPQSICMEKPNVENPCGRHAEKIRWRETPLCGWTRNNPHAYRFYARRIWTGGWERTELGTGCQFWGFIFLIHMSFDIKRKRDVTFYGHFPNSRKRPAGKTSGLCSPLLELWPDREWSGLWRMCASGLNPTHWLCGPSDPLLLYLYKGDKGPTSQGVSEDEKKWCMHRANFEL